MKRSMKKTALTAAVLFAAAAFAGCGASAEPERNEVTAVTEQASPAAALPKEEFSKLPEGKEESLNYLSDAIDEAFPDVSGRKMYGFKGVETIEAGSSEQDCYIFDFYTYTKKTDEYTKIATVAQIPDTEELYVLDDETGKFTEPSVN